MKKLFYLTLLLCASAHALSSRAVVCYSAEELAAKFKQQHFHLELIAVSPSMTLGVWSVDGGTLATTTMADGSGCVVFEGGASNAALAQKLNQQWRK